MARLVTFPVRVLFFTGREDDNTLTVAFSPPEPAAVPFVATGLGKALARIEAELKKERQKKADAEAKLDKLNSLQGLRALTEGEDQSFRGAQEQVRRSQKTINSLDAEKTDLQVRAAAGTAAAGKGVGATERQLDNLLLRDAIRDIPRR